MQVKLRQVGNSIGLTIPTSELKLMNAHVGDLIEIEIKRVIRHARADWNNPELWAGADVEPMLLETAAAPAFDKDWQW
jgi:antitoxin component of MazEF toxin-antitoxin module